MGWIGYSLLMFFSSVVLYLVIRKLSLIKVPTELVNLSMFVAPLVLFIVIGLSSGTDFSISAWHWLVIAISAIVFSYGGNVASLKAIDIAPNPGYSLVVSKSYVLFTTIVSVLLLGQVLSWTSAIAIVLIVGFSALIMISPKSAKHVKSNKWVWLSLASFFAWGMLSLSSKYLFTNGVEMYTFLIYLYVFVIVFMVASNRINRRMVRGVAVKNWAMLLAVGVLCTLFNIGQFEAIRLAPNVGYVNAINAGSISLVTVMAVVFFKDELTLKKALGVVGVTIGVILLLV